MTEIPNAKKSPASREASGAGRDCQEVSTRTLGAGGRGMTFYKVTDSDGEPHNGGSGAWRLPKNGKPGAWRKAKGKLMPCVNGLHLCRESDLIEWLGPFIWEAEYRGKMIGCDDKIVVREARLIRQCGGWTEQTARLFAADCAERVLKIADDKRCDAAILAARQYAFGLIDDAARAATAAARAATAAARSATAAARAATAAARAAAWNATAAARAAARSAAWPATDAATAATRAATDAAWAAACDAEQEWQTERLLQYLAGKVDLDAIRKSVEGADQTQKSPASR